MAILWLPKLILTDNRPQVLKVHLLYSLGFIQVNDVLRSSSDSSALIWIHNLFTFFQNKSGSLRVWLHVGFNPISANYKVITFVLLTNYSLYNFSFSEVKKSEKNVNIHILNSYIRNIYIHQFFCLLLQFKFEFIFHFKALTVINWNKTWAIRQLNLYQNFFILIGCEGDQSAEAN